MMLGKSFDELSGITLVSGRELFDTFYESLVALATPDIGDFLPLLKPLGLQQSLRRRSYAAFERLDTIFQRIIDHRRNGSGDADLDHDDLLGTLLALHADKAPAAAASQLPHTFTDDNIKAIFWVQSRLSATPPIASIPEQMNK
jgi:cytochrome P450